jgi:glycosyltransferase involved in cell wall biosynthesis
MSNTVEISVIIPVSERFDKVRDLYDAYKRGLDESGYSYEIIYVLDGEKPDYFEQLVMMQKEGNRLRIIKLAKCFGEATALAAGFEHSYGEIIVTLPAYYQMEPEEIPRLLNELQGDDMVIGRRWPRTDSPLNQLQTRAFHWMLRLVTGVPFRDLGCSVRAFRRPVAAEVSLYGDQHRFLPLLAQQRGFRVKEIDVTQANNDRFLRLYRLGVYPRRMLDILTVFFLVKFTKKPLRFFGLTGAATCAVGALSMLYLVIERYFWGVPLSERPILLLSSLLIVLGVQIFALGLIGELMIFAHAKELKEYTVAKIVSTAPKVESLSRKVLFR